MISGQGAYLFHLLAWSLPVLAAQVGFLAWRGRGELGKLGSQLRAALPPVAVVTLYLVLADHWAIGDGIWHFDARQILGVHLGRVPLEEALFFLITNLLVAFGLLLLWRPPEP